MDFSNILLTLSGYKIPISITMKVTGFTFIRNAIKYEYPIIESITSILPICDAFVVAVGNSDDDTLNLIRGIDPDKITIIETVWDDSLRTDGKVLAIETDKAFRAIAEDSDWNFYIQGDEVVHEKYLDTIYSAMKKWKDNTEVDGLLFKYMHFYGSYDYIGASTQWYRHEIRVVKNNKNIYSYRDAQGFRKGNNEKLNVKAIDAYIYHYGWVREPKALQRKQLDFNRLWHDDAWIDRNIKKGEEFDYTGIDALNKFTGTHPKVMQNLINRKNWTFEFDLTFNKLSVKDSAKLLLEKIGIKVGYKNYRIY